MNVHINNLATAIGFIDKAQRLIEEVHVEGDLNNNHLSIVKKNLNKSIDVSRSIIEDVKAQNRGILPS
jgi:hypothetical protein